MHIQPLPPGTILASGERRPDKSVRLTCWLPDRFATTPAADQADIGDIEEEFYEDYCRSCIYYFDEDSLNRSDCEEQRLTDSRGNPIVSAEIESRCPCHSEGLAAVDWPCVEGYSGPDDEAAGSDSEIELSPMAFAVDIAFTSSSIYSSAIKAWCQTVNEDGLCGGRYQAGNTYDDDRVCWGNDNDEPDTLATAAVTYGDAPGNSDLLSPDVFSKHRRLCRAEQPEHPLPGLLVPGGYDALLLATRESTPAAYLLLRGSGIPADDGLIVIGLKATQQTLEDGSTVSGYVSEPACGNRRWLLINDPDQLDDSPAGHGLLLGQLPPDPLTPCNSITPSSSAPAAVAAI